MTLGYDGKLFILAFDHRGSFQKKFFGVEGAPTPEDTPADHRREDPDLRGRAEGARRRRGPDSSAGVLVDEQFGTGVANAAKQQGLMLAMPCEKSGQNEFDFEYGSEFTAHIRSFDPDFTKVLVRYNPQGDGAMNGRQSARLKELSDWLHANDKRFLFELLVPAEPHQLESVGGDVGRFDRELRPRPDAAGDRRAAGGRDRAGHLEDRGHRRHGGVRGDRRAVPDRGARPRRVRGAGPRRRSMPPSMPGCVPRGASTATAGSRSDARSGGTR